MMLSEYYHNLTDTDLLGLLKKEDREAFDQIYTRYFSSLYSYAFKVLQDKEECQDTIQDLFIWLWENKSNLGHIENLHSYLIASVKYKLVRAVQTSRRHAQIIASQIPKTSRSCSSNDYEVKELKRVIADIITLMPERSREVLTLSRQQYLSNKEIAHRLGISEKTVENHLTISLRKLRTELGKILSLFFL